jgi:hypothetical protein
VQQHDWRAIAPEVPDHRAGPAGRAFNACRSFQTGQVCQRFQSTSLLRAQRAHRLRELLLEQRVQVLVHRLGRCFQRAPVAGRGLADLGRLQIEQVEDEVVQVLSHEAIALELLGGEVLWVERDDQPP